MTETIKPGDLVYLRHYDTTYYGILLDCYKDLVRVDMGALGKQTFFKDLVKRAVGRCLSCRHQATDHDHGRCLFGPGTFVGLT